MKLTPIQQTVLKAVQDHQIKYQYFTGNAYLNGIKVNRQLDRLTELELIHWSVDWPAWEPVIGPMPPMPEPKRKGQSK